MSSNTKHKQRPNGCLIESELQTKAEASASEPLRITKSFLCAATLAFALLVVGTHPQVLRGKVPLPADVITVFPPWYAVSREPTTPHAEVSDAVTLFYPWR